MEYSFDFFILETLKAVAAVFRCLLPAILAAFGFWI